MSRSTHDATQGETDSLTDLSKLGFRESPNRKLRVLIVEDSRDFAEVVMEVVQALGHEATKEHSPGAALEHLQRRPDGFDVLLADLGYPDGSGLELARLASRLRQDGKSSLRRVVAISGFDDAALQRSATEAGFDQFLLKPIDFEQLERILDGVSPDGL